MADLFAEFTDALRGWLPEKLSALPECAELVTALRAIDLDVDTFEELLPVLVQLEPTIRAAVAPVQAVDPDLARGLSKLADVPQLADLLEPADMLERLEFLRVRAG
jgi:hypothetical protein